MYCNRCGAKVPDESMFCPECGVKLAKTNKKGGKASTANTKNERIIAKAEQLKNGNTRAFDELYDLTHNRVYYLALKITQNREDALEAVQETYLSVYRKIGGLANPAVFRAWISKIVVNKCMDLLGKQKEYLALDSREQGEEDIFDRMEEVASDFIPHEALDKEETRNMMISLIDNLPALQRITILLYYYQQLDVNEIADVMDCPVATVKSRLQYARKKIKQGVEEYETQGVKLYGFGCGLGLAYALKELAKYNTLPPTDASNILNLVRHTIARAAPGGGALSSSGNPAQPSAHVGTSHTGVGHMAAAHKAGFFSKIAQAPLGAKIIAGIAAATIAGTAGLLVFNTPWQSNTQTATKQSDDTGSETTNDTSTETETETEKSTEELISEAEIPSGLSDEETAKLIIDRFSDWNMAGATDELYKKTTSNSGADYDKYLSDESEKWAEIYAKALFGNDYKDNQEISAMVDRFKDTNKDCLSCYLASKAGSSHGLYDMNYTIETIKSTDNNDNNRTIIVDFVQSDNAAETTGSDADLYGHQVVTYNIEDENGKIVIKSLSAEWAE